MCIRRHRIDNLWPFWELGMLDEAWPPEEVGHANGY